MTAYLLTNHIFNFMAPAALLALGLVLLARVFSGFFQSKRPVAQSLWLPTAIVFIANLLVLAVGLVFFGNDGKMATYAVMVVVAAVCQWALWRGWRR